MREKELYNSVRRKKEEREREKKKRELDYSRTGYYNNECNVQNNRGVEQ